MASLVCHLISVKRIKTTLSKAKAAQRLAEKMVTLAKRGTLADRRRALSILRQADAVKQLFEQIAPPCKDRAGGYTRIIKLGLRRSDSSSMALLEWVSIAPVDRKKKKPAPAEEKKDEAK